MKKVLYYTFMAIMVVSLSSCARGCQGLKRSTIDNTAHKIKVTHYSGGKVIGEWTINGIVNSSESSDGYYFYVNGNLVEVSGDVRLEYLD